MRHFSRKESAMTDNYKYVKSSIYKRRQRINKEFKEGRPCARCGNIYPSYVLDFHHLEPKNKKFAIGTGLYRNGWDKIVAEISKCVLLCANCHRTVEHIKRGGGEVSHNPHKVAQTSSILVPATFARGARPVRATLLHGGGCWFESSLGH